MPVLGLLVALALVAANAFFVSAEFALARVRPTQVAEWERLGRPGAGSLRHGIEHIDAYLAACQLGITVASLGLGAVGEPAFHDLLEPVLDGETLVASVGLASALAFAIITLMHVVGGELAPKSVSIARTERIALLVAPPMRVFYSLTKPVVDLFNGMGNLLLKPFGIPPAREVGHAPATEHELHELLRESARMGLIDPDEQVVAENALRLDDLRVRQVMVPRARVRYVTTDMDVAGAVNRVRETGVTRLPLCEPEGGLDAPVGLIHAKDLLIELASMTQGRSLLALARPLDRIPEAVLVDEVLDLMRRRREHLVLVADEHGTTVGALALEHILEVLVGEIEDEFDQPIQTIRREHGELLVSGSAPLHAIVRELGLTLSHDQEATIGGLVVERLGHIPQIGDVVEVDGLRLEVTDVQDARVLEVRLVEPPAGATGEPAPRAQG